MAHPEKAFKGLLQRASFVPKDSLKGVTLLEMAMGMMIIAVLSVGVSSLVRTAMEAQLSERTQQNLQLISRLIVDDLRRDFQQADVATISGGGSTLTLEIPVSPGSGVTYSAIYRLDSGTEQFSRRNTAAAGIPARTKIYNNPKDYPGFVIRCAANCFKRPSTRLITIDWLRVAKATSNSSVIDKEFGPPNYLVRDLAFDIAAANTFQ